MTTSLLVHSIKQGDEKAFRVMYESYFPKVINYAQKLLRSREDAREVAQDVFIKLWTKRYELDPNQSVAGLIFRITKFLAIDRIRKQEHNIKTSAFSGSFEISDRSLETEYMGKELHSIYLGSIQKLPRKRRLIFQLSRNRNLPYKKISQRLKISTKTVEAQIRLALQQIREDIGKYATL